MNTNTTKKAVAKIPGVPYPGTVKSRLREFMNIRGLSLSDMERLTGLARTTIVKATKDGEAGVDSCNLTTLKKLATAVGMRPKDLFDDAD